MGYTSILYVCDTVDGCQILHQLRDVVKKNMGFNMFQPSKGGAGFRKNPQLSTYSDSALDLTNVFWDYSILIPLYSQCKRLTMENHHVFHATNEIMFL